MACKKTGPLDPNAAGRRWRKRLAPVVGLVTVLLAVGGVWAGQATTRPSAAAAAATRPPPSVQTVPTPPTAASAPSTTSPAPPETQPPVAPPATVPTKVIAPRPAVTVAVPAAPNACAVALAYLAAHAAPGFAHFCRPGSLQTAMGASTAYTCLPGTGYSCPDGVAEIIIAEPTCAASYENEALELPLGLLPRRGGQAGHGAERPDMGSVRHLPLIRARTAQPG